MRHVGRAEFLTNSEAADRLGKVSVGWLVFTGALERARCREVGVEGVTRQSVEREIEWQQQATQRMKVRRTVRGLVRLADVP